MNCFAIGERVRKTKKPILITRFGKPVAEVVLPPAPKPDDWLGSLAGTGRVVADTISRANDESEWEVFH